MKKLNHELGCFNVYECENGVYAISEAYKDITATSYLICGDNQSILLDTGCGIGRIKKLVFSLTSLKPIIMNSHPAPYHSGANKKFDIVQILNEENGIDYLTFGKEDDWIASQEKLMEEDVTFFPSMFTTVTNGKVYPLGGKYVEIIANDATKINGMMLADHENKQLFTGDIFDETFIENLDENQKQDYLNELKNVIHQYQDYTWYFSIGDINPERKSELIKKYA